MLLSRKDLAATAVTGLAVAVFVTTHQGWDVWLIGGSHRWAAGAITLLGMVGCSLGSPGRDAANKFDTTARWISVLGVTALALAVVAIWTGSLTALSLLLADFVVLWAVSTLRHSVHVHMPHRPVAL